MATNCLAAERSPFMLLISSEIILIEMSSESPFMRGLSAHGVGGNGSSAAFLARRDLFLHLAATEAPFCALLSLPNHRPTTVRKFLECVQFRPSYGNLRFAVPFLELQR